MRLSRLWWLSLPLCAAHVVQAQQQPVQLTFEVTEGAQLRQAGQANERARGSVPFGTVENDDNSNQPPLVVQFTSDDPASSNHDHLYQLALSLLDSLTAHSPPAPPTAYSPHLASPLSSTPNPVSVALDKLEHKLSGTVTGSMLGRTRTVMGKVGQFANGFTSLSSSRLQRGGATARKNGGGSKTENILRAVVAQIKAVLGTDTGASKPARAGSAAHTGRAAESASAFPSSGSWKGRIGAAALLRGEHIVLSDDEIADAWREVVDLAEKAAEAGSVDALVLLGNLHLGGATGFEADPSRAVEYFTQASERYGSGEAQYKLGFLYGSNYGGALGGLEGQGQQGSALLHYTFSALSGYEPASMTVGYRHWAGIGTKQSCKDALPWYKAAADSAIRSFNSGPPGGRHLPPPKIRLSDHEGGPYGPGASSTRASMSTGGSSAQTRQEWDDLVEYHLFHAEHGDVAYMYRLARLYYQGFGGLGLGGTRDQPRGRLRMVRQDEANGVSAGTANGGGGVGHDGLWDGGRDFYRASKWFVRVARRLWPVDPKEATWDPAWGPVPGASSSSTTTAARSKQGARAGAGAANGNGNKAAVPATPRIGYFDPTKDRKNDKLDPHSAMVAGLAAGYLGRMYLMGEGVPVSYAKAHLWFSRGQKQGDRESNNGLGIMYRDGLGVARDLKKANMLFHAAAQQDLPEAQVNLGKFHFGMGDFALANTYFEHAIRSDNTRTPDTFQAYYYLAELAARSSTDSCPTAVSFYKRVAERGDWDHEVWWEAERARERGDLRTALLGYWMMAERGYEVAQNNVAWILDSNKQRLRLPLFDAAAPLPSAAVKQLDRLALTYWTRSAAQDNVDALVKMGDYYYSGLGTEDGLPQLEKAAGCYQSAATTRFSAMAMWNLGWMHEIGKGVPQDFHLAKRNYDMALETSGEAFFPSSLSLLGLYGRALWHAITKSGDDELKALSLFGRDPDPDGVGTGFAEHGLWTFGRAWRDIQRSWGVDPGPDPEALAVHAAGQAEGAPVDGAAQPAAHQERGDMRAAQRALEGAEDQMEWEGYRGRGRGGEGDEEEFYMDDEGDFGGTVAIVALSMLLAWLLYFRQRPEQRRQAHPVPAPAPAPAATPNPPPPPPAPTATPAPQPPAENTSGGSSSADPAEGDERQV